MSRYCACQPAGDPHMRPSGLQHAGHARFERDTYQSGVLMWLAAGV